MAENLIQPEYYIAMPNEKIGPKTYSEIIEMIDLNKVMPYTLLWTTGMTNWDLAISFREFRDKFSHMPPPSPIHSNGSFMPSIDSSGQGIQVPFPDITIDKGHHFHDHHHGHHEHHCSRCDDHINHSDCDHHHCHEDIHVHFDKPHNHGTLPHATHIDVPNLDFFPCGNKGFKPRGIDEFLKVSNYLSEFNTESARKKARRNLGIDNLPVLWQNITGNIELNELLMDLLYSRFFNIFDDAESQYRRLLCMINTVESGYISQWLDLKPFGGCGDMYAVDLGLPSKTLWYSANLGAQSSIETGYRYAFGEVYEKDNFIIDNSVTYGVKLQFTGNTFQGRKEFDAATFKNASMAVPTDTQWSELINGTNKQYGITDDGVKYIKFINKTDPDKFIVIPFCGQMIGENVLDEDKFFYWSSSYEDTDLTCGNGIISIADKNTGIYHYFNDDIQRYIGLPIRPVTVGKPYDPVGPHNLRASVNPSSILISKTTAVTIKLTADKGDAEITEWWIDGQKGQERVIELTPTTLDKIEVECMVVDANGKIDSTIVYINVTPAPEPEIKHKVYYGVQKIEDGEDMSPIDFETTGINVTSGQVVELLNKSWFASNFLTHIATADNENWQYSWIAFPSSWSMQKRSDAMGNAFSGSELDRIYYKASVMIENQLYTVMWAQAGNYVQEDSLEQFKYKYQF